MLNKYNLMSDFVKQTNPTVEILDYIIRNNFNYFLIYNKERDAYVLFERKDYKGITKKDNIYYIYSNSPMAVVQVDKITNIWTETYISTFEIDIYNKDEVIGFRDMDEAIKYCGRNSINTCKNKLVTKLIFSPQLANFLLDSGYKLIHIKKHNITNSTVYVFTVEENFYQEIGNYRKQYENNNNNNNDEGVLN